LSRHRTRALCLPADQKSNRSEEANFTRAAERVHISQSGVSAQIRQLERELGTELIDRSGRRATLTSAGQAALEPARAALASAGAVRGAVDEVFAVIRGRLTVGMVIGCTISPLFDALAAFRKAHPGVEIALAEDNSAQLIERVRSGAADVALIAAAGRSPEGLAAHPIVIEPLIAAVPPAHPLASAKRVSLRHVVAHPIVSLPPGTGVRTAFDRDCAAAGLAPDVALEASAPQAVVDLARGGLGVAILSRSMVADTDDSLVARPVEGLTTEAVLALVWEPTPNPALHELLAHLRREFAPAPSPPRS
jgi:DNA-binding transcriptional LysR family regulator